MQQVVRNFRCNFESAHILFDKKKTLDMTLLGTFLLLGYIINSNNIVLYNFITNVANKGIYRGSFKDGRSHTVEIQLEIATFIAIGIDMALV